MPHGHCYLWNTGLVSLHVVSDMLIGLSYVAISLTLAYLVGRARSEMPFGWMIIAFGTFIIACGATHFMEVLTVWQGWYWTAGHVKLVTAAASVITALLLPPLVPKVLTTLAAAKASDERKTRLEATYRELESVYGKLKELDTLKTDFFANVSHELRTPLALVLGPVRKLAADPSLSESQRRDLAVAERNAATLLKHVNDLLDVAKLDAGRMVAVRADVDAARLMRLTAAHFEVFAADRGIALTVQAPESLPARLDPEKIQRVLLNLLSNAFKFTPDGGRVTCRAAVETVGKADERVIVLEVADSGPGVRPELRGAIFDRFRQGDPAGRGHGGSGTGLGLAIVREFTALHGGRVTVGDAPGGGALFRIELPETPPPVPQLADGPVPTAPVVPAVEPGGVPDPASGGDGLDDAIRAEVLATQVSLIRHDRVPPLDGPTPIPAAAGNATGPAAPEPAGTAAPKQVAAASPVSDAPLILVVEDNPDMNRFVCSALAESGVYRVASAADGIDGAAKAAELRPDLILSDVMMPRLDGEGLLARLLSDPATAETPVVMLTARGDADVRAKLLKRGAADHLGKPFSVEELLARVGNLVSIHRARRTLRNRLDSADRDVAALADRLAARNRDLAEANRLKDEFLATLSHELRTPLHSILGWVQLLRAGGLDGEEMQTGLETIERSARAQNQLIKDLLDVSRIITGKMRIDPRPVQPSAIVSAAIDAVRPAAEAKGITLSAELDRFAGPVNADPDRLQQIAWNLLTNAIKFTPRGGRVDVRVARVEGSARLTVRDTGIGIERNFLPHLFERFRQADSSTTRSYGGLGLGLALVRHLAELHGGTVEAASDGPGKGAEFAVALPLVGVAAGGSSRPSAESASAEAVGPRRSDGPERAAGPQGAEAGGKPPRSAGPLAGVTVLVVDDDPDARALVERLLRRGGAEVTAAGSAEEAMALIDRRPPDVLVSDIGMPGEDGVALIRRVRSLDPERGGRIPAAALTAFAREEERNRALAAGFQRHLAKPVEPGELTAAVAALAGRV
jgi:signal transduction histidine kinase